MYKILLLWDGRPGNQYGRLASFYYQLEELNLASAWEEVWEEVDAPVLVLHGEYHWIMSHGDHELIAETVNAGHPGRVTFVGLPKTSHLLMNFPRRPGLVENPYMDGLIHKP